MQFKYSFNTMFYKSIVSRASFCAIFLSLFYKVNSWDNFRRFDGFAEEILGPKYITHVHGNITFGDCRNATVDIMFNVSEPVERMGVNSLLRGWVDVDKLPRCVIMIPRQYKIAVEFVSPLFQIMMCLGKVIFTHSFQRFYYYYYEWFFPVEWTPTTWDLYFFAKKTEVKNATKD